MVPIAITLSVMSYYNAKEQNWTLIFSIQLLMAIALIGSVIMMRRVIKQTNFAQPNECLVIIHVINFLVVLLGTLTLVII